ncbi:MAG: NifB/NifX family molybdenum-iron cluster-binding protein [Vicinamibacteria bacterium]
MRICIPTDDERGLAGAVAGHFGRAPFLTLVDVDSGEVAVVANRPHGEGHCNPVAAIAGHGVGAVLCAGAGRRAVAALEHAGIRVLVTGASRVEEAVGELRRGAARSLSVDEACGGHHGEHDGGCRH